MDLELVQASEDTWCGWCDGDIDEDESVYFDHDTYEMICIECIEEDRFYDDYIWD